MPGMMLGSMALLATVVGPAVAIPFTDDPISATASQPRSTPEWEVVFRSWMQKFGKDYGSDLSAFQQRLQVFQDNARYVQTQNQASTSLLLELNEFADMTFEEFSSQKLGYVPEMRVPDLSSRLPTFRHGDTEAADSVDWVSEGAVTAVKNQGQCGSCWAFSTTGSIEGLNYLRTGSLEALSEQELVDCDRSEDMGCSGGLMDNAFHYVVQNGGIDTENDYQYWANFPSFCNRRKQADRHVVDITGFEDVPANDEDALAKAVTNQPVSVAICANRDFMFYKSGVFGDGCCTQLNHGVLAVGYGTSGDNEPYWKVKNSWGPGWGEDGYVRLEKDVPDKQGTCGIAMDASYPVKSDTTDPVVPTICDAQMLSLWECKSGTQCACDFNVFGLLCVWYSCEPNNSVDCGDGEHFCPMEAPLCDFEWGRCEDEQGVYNSAMLFKTKATRRKQD